MAATVTLSTTTLVAPCGSGDGAVRLASLSGVTVGKRLWVDRELMAVVGTGPSDRAIVRRGVSGTSGAAHASGAVVTIGDANQFYAHDPQGRPPDAVPVQPWINTENGKVFYAQGDDIPADNPNRWWQEQTTEYITGALGIRIKTTTP